LFDASWYREINKDLLHKHITLEHYLHEGWRERKSPHPLFLIDYYYAGNPDIKNANVEPLFHFVTTGWKEGRNPHPLFDVRYYCSQFPSIHSLNIDPLTHYITAGWKQGFWPHKIFNPEWYLRQNVDVRELGEEPLLHYMRAGWKENRRPTPFFDPDAYRRRRDISTDVNPLLDYALFERRPTFNGWAPEPELNKGRYNLELADPGQVSLARPLGIFIQLRREGGADEIASHVARIDAPKNIYVATDSEQKKSWIRAVFERYGIAADIAVVADLDSDDAAFLFGFSERFVEHDVCIRISGGPVRGLSAESAEEALHRLLSDLIGDAARVRSVVHSFAAAPRLGILMAALPVSPDARVGACDAAERHSAMFWFRPQALCSVFNLNLRAADFTPPPGRESSALAPPVEHNFSLICQLSDMEWAVLPDRWAAFELTREGAERLLKESGVFDAVYYCKTYPDIAAAGVDPLRHWIDTGVHEGRDPSAWFRTGFYMRVIRADWRAKVNPLVHYLLEGRERGLPTAPSARVGAAIVVDDLYAPYVPLEARAEYVGETKPIVRRSDVKLIAFYLPQFHPFTENDKFWGRGFTEWTNTTKAVPMFRGHYQPRLPGELGFYDTRLKSVIARQIELARQYGVHGFCLHHYFFDGKPVMRAPYELILANPDLDIPFCLHWANEPWTVRFDGLSTKAGVLLEQHHSADDDIAFFRDIEPALRDPRYIKIHGRPLLVIYRPGLFPDIKATLDRWRECCRRAGLEELYLVVMQTLFEGEVDPDAYGFDAAIEFPPHSLRVCDVGHRLDLYDAGSPMRFYDYEHAVEQALERPDPSYRLFRGIMPGWDNSPRRANSAAYINCAPHRYERWLTGLCKKTAVNRPRDEKLIFINAWNEWAEGAYLEPDRKHGYAYLNATARALNAHRGANIDALGLRILVIGHIYYTELLDEFIAHFHKIPGRFDLLITTPFAKQSYVNSYISKNLKSGVGSIKVKGAPNIGFDFGPFLLSALPEAQDYDVCCKVHSKKTPYNSQFLNWRQFLLRNLMGSEENIAAILEEFAVNPRLGLVYPQAFGPVRPHLEWGSNFEIASMLLQKLGVVVSSDAAPDFPAGSMFWFRPKALAPLQKLGLTLDDFNHLDGGRDPTGRAVIDGTLAHALERIICYVAKHAGYDCREALFEF
jgi:lipopolysaccharide biosynthesis protein